MARQVREQAGGMRVHRLRTIPRMSRRAASAHKGDFGRVLVIGGSRGMIGAPALAANAALRAGAGLAVAGCPKGVQPFVAVLCPCATSIALPETSEGLVDLRAAARALRGGGQLSMETGPQAVVFGPGLGRGGAKWARELSALVEAFSSKTRATLVIDADALNALTLERAGGRLRRAIFTPHPGEMARLVGKTSGYVQAHRMRMALETAGRLNRGARSEAERSVVVLKGAGTIVTDGARLYVNRTGNPGMATGGTGDVLSGVIAALAAQGMPPLEAAILGVYVHGLAGDVAAREKGQVSPIASDLLEALPRAFRSIGR